MLKLSLVLNCDSCGNIFLYPRLIHNDVTAIAVHVERLSAMAQHNGWFQSSDGNCFHCRSCLDQNEELTLL